VEQKKNEKFVKLKSEDLTAQNLSGGKKVNVNGFPMNVRLESDNLSEWNSSKVGE